MGTIQEVKRFRVTIRRKIERKLWKLPANVQKLLKILVLDLEERGPIQEGWPNFSALEEGRYHCHLTRSYVACWKWDKGSIEIEVYYAGSRQGAPY